jgi:glycosyltransferase involved in cell wall biosynthesis
MSKIAIFSAFFGYNAGGAEFSVLELMKEEARKGHDIVAFVNDNPVGYGKLRKIELPSSWEVRAFHLFSLGARFRFLQYFINRRVCKCLSETLHDVDVLYAYGHFAPALINAFSGKTVYLVRDEFGLGWNVNYYKGLRGFLQSLYHLCEWPLYWLWRLELRSAIQKSNLIANSEFVRRELDRLAPSKNIELIFSQVDVEKLQEDYFLNKGSVDTPGVVVIGDNILKGGDIARKVAALLPDMFFYIFDRRYHEMQQEGNIFFMPWQSPGCVYAHAKMVMVPSRWQEAFPRVILEARALNLPVVASMRGGIPEAMHDFQEGLISDLENINEWVQRITYFYG